MAVAEATARRAEGSAEEAEDATSDLAVVAIAADLEAGEGKFLQIIVDPCFFCYDDRTRYRGWFRLQTPHDQNPLVASSSLCCR